MYKITNKNRKYLLVLSLLFSSMQFIFAAEGDLDTTFNPSGPLPGTVQTTISGSDMASAVAIQSDGKIVVAGSTRTGIIIKFAIARYNTDGSLDTTFNPSGAIPGIVQTNINNSAKALAVAIQSDGKIVAAGFTTVGGIVKFAIARYNTDGSLDTTTFNPSGAIPGVIQTSINGINDQATSVKIQTDGKIVVAGFTRTLSGSFEIAVVRYNTDGSLDATFGSGGIVQTNINGVIDEAFALAIQRDGKIIVVGVTRVGFISRFAVVRYNTDGSLDTSFGQGGIVQTNINNIDDEAFAVAIQADGKIVVAGLTNTVSDILFAVARYNTDGSLDASFGQGGIVQTNINGIDDEAFAVAIQSDGKIVVGGVTIAVGFIIKFAVVRYNTNGSLDTTFGSGGIVQTSVDAGINGIAIQSDGKIVAVGSKTGPTGVFVVARYFASTSLIQTPITIAIKNKYCGNGA